MPLLKYLQDFKSIYFMVTREKEETKHIVIILKQVYTHTLYTHIQL